MWNIIKKFFRKKEKLSRYHFGDPIVLHSYDFDDCNNANWYESDRCRGTVTGITLHSTAHYSFTCVHCNKVYKDIPETKVMYDSMVSERDIKFQLTIDDIVDDLSNV